MVRAEAAMRFEARTDRLGTMTVVALTGDLDIASEADAVAALDAAIGDGGGVLVADLRELAFLDSTGVRVLLAADLHAKDRGVRFGVARSDGMVRRLLEVTRIEQRFPVVDDPAELAEGDAPSSAAQ
jgi:anti-sigma B factor antagonist